MDVRNESTIDVFFWRHIDVFFWRHIDVISRHILIKYPKNSSDIGQILTKYVITRQKLVRKWPISNELRQIWSKSDENDVNMTSEKDVFLWRQMDVFFRQKMTIMSGIGHKMTKSVWNSSEIGHEMTN